MAKHARVHDVTDAPADTNGDVAGAANDKLDGIVDFHGFRGDVSLMPRNAQVFAMVYGARKIAQDRVSGDKKELIAAHKAVVDGSADANTVKLLGEAIQEIGSDQNTVLGLVAEQFSEQVVAKRIVAALEALWRGETSAPRTGGGGRTTSWETLRRQAAAAIMEEIAAEKGVGLPGKNTDAYKANLAKLLSPEYAGAARVETKARELADRKSAVSGVLEL